MVYKKKIDWLECPGRSPDLNQTENLWVLLLSRIDRNARQFQNLEEIKEAVLLEKDILEDNTFRAFFDSKQRRSITL